MIKLAPTYGYYQKKKRRITRITLICQECGEEYEVYPYEKDKRKYCSRTCASRNFNRTRTTKRVVTKECGYCGEEFTRVVQKSRPEPKYCCTDCANRHRVVLQRKREFEEVERELNEQLCYV